MEVFSGEENGRCKGEGSLNLRKTVDERTTLYLGKNRGKAETR